MNRLNEIEARAHAATEGPWEGIRYPDGLLGRVIAHARTDVPALVAALKAALNEHPTGVFHSFAGDVQWCDACDGPYPCPTVAAIRQHLGEDA